MSFNIATSGLNSVTEQLNAISHNIANVGTTGFKSSRVEFGSLYADGQAMGVGVISMTQSVGQNGALVNTGRDLDMGISGGGFFITRGTNGDTSYTRNGVFGTDKDNFVVDANGQNLMGYPVDAAGNLLVGTLRELQILSGNIPARATDTLDFTLNLNAGEKVPTVTPFDPDNADSYNFTYTTKVFDSQGKEHTVTQYFAKTADNRWQAHYYNQGQSVGGPQLLEFSPGGGLTAPTGTVDISFTLPGVNPMNIAIDYTGTTQYGSDFVVTTNKASGYAAGEQTGLAVEKDGKVYAKYSNGERLLQGQVVMASFANAGGLKNENGTRWSATGESGAPLLGTPGSGPLGSLSAGTLEASNVDLTQQLVGLMEGQRNYQANSKVLTTSKELTQILFGSI
ncbi:flagellar hook protein FlgE [Pseudomonas sp. HR96]|uniref:flagellar hook protein FlgE n=1 Tax=Pseudomonas sp. HR96 TaxID=1027966 RepID=UPI002A75FFB7|nr:flagellar hook protein FlgE [Pseudomonas sp. HR96]WPP00075.1 flagellar hook protein FlgE [Pseudomonas sp. HR96]